MLAGLPGPPKRAVSWTREQARPHHRRVVGAVPGDGGRARRPDRARHRHAPGQFARGGRHRHGERLDGSRGRARALTGESGAYELRLPGAGRYEVRVLRIGFRPDDRARVRHRRRRVENAAGRRFGARRSCSPRSGCRARASAACGRTPARRSRGSGKRRARRSRRRSSRHGWYAADREVGRSTTPDHGPHGHAGAHEVDEQLQRRRARRRSSVSRRTRSPRWDT